MTSIEIFLFILLFVFITALYFYTLHIDDVIGHLRKTVEKHERSLLDTKEDVRHVSLWLETNVAKDNKDKDYLRIIANEHEFNR